MRNNTLLFWVLMLVDGVFGSDEVTSVSVMEGDSFTLHTKLTQIQGDDKIIWNFGDEIIAKIHEGAFSTPDGRFRHRLKLDKQTGSLTITNIRAEHAGDYSVDIKMPTTADLSKFKVTVHGGVKIVSVKEGDSVILHTGVTNIQGYDLILWKLEDNLIGEINQQTKLFLRHDRDNRFNGRLQLHPQTGSLMISDSETTDSGVYHLNMSSSSHALQRTVSVTVKNSGSSAAVSGASFGLLVWAVTVLLLQEVSVKIK